MSLLDSFDLGINYKKYFEVVPAFSETLKEAVYRIRHQVYCVDLGFEAPKPDGLEHDDYDPNSLHLLIRSLKTGDFVGCTRIIRAWPAEPERMLPFEKACIGTIDRSVIDPGRLPRDTIGEVSRLAVVAQFRRRKEDDKRNNFTINDADFGTAEQPRFPYIPVALYLGTIELARLHNIKTLFVLTERRLAVHFKRLGVNIQPIGGPVEHRGERVPSMLDPIETITNMRAMARPLYRVIAEEISNGAALPSLP